MDKERKDEDSLPTIDLASVPCGPDLALDDEAAAEFERLMHWHNTPPDATEFV